MWQTAPGLQVVPYIEGTPAGTPRRADVLWIDRKLYAEPLSRAKLAKRVPEEIGKAFGRSDIRDALSYSCDRSAEDVSAYLEENFKLAPLRDAAIEEKPQTASTQNKDQPVENAETVTSPQDELDEGSVPTEEIAPEQHTEPVQEYLDESQDARPHRPRVQPKPPKPSIMERFAAAHGFKKDDDGRFFHSSGAWIGKTHEMCFPWERRTNSGELTTYYLDVDHCLEHEPLQLAAEVWHLLKEASAQYALILASADGAPVEISGTELKELEKEGKLKLYPASYRIALESKEHA